MRWLLLLSISCITIFGKAQDSDGTSVVAQLIQARSSLIPVEERLKIYDELGWDHYLNTSPDSAELVADAMLALADSVRAHAEAVSALRLKAVSLAQRGDLTQAIAEARKALERCERHGLDELLPKAYTSLGIFHNQSGDLVQAMASHTLALQAYEKADDGPGMASALNNLGFVYYDARDTTQALRSFQRAVAIRDSVGIEDMNLNSLGNIGGVFMDQDKPDEALPYLLRALAIAERTEDRVGLASAHSNLGACYKMLSDTDQAIHHLLRSNEYASALGMPGIESVNLLVMAELAERAGDRREALALATKAHALAKDIGDIYLLENASSALYTYYKKNGNAARALVFHEAVLSLRDSLANDRNRSEVMRQQAQYEFEKREALLQAEQEKKDALARAELRRRELQRNASIAGLLALALVAAIILRQRNRINKEKRRSEELLLNILPEEVAEELKAKGSAEAVLIDQVTVLFTDFKGFTAMSEQLSPKDLVKDLHECFSAFDNICEKHGLEKIKTIGDAYMAAGGLPTPNTTHATDVIMAAFEMRDFIAEGKARRIASGLPFFQIRIGIHTGPVVAGIVGVKKFQYDIWGDTVNTASRMESSGEVGQVNISEGTYALVKDAVVGMDGGAPNPQPATHQPATRPTFTFTPRGKVQAKGKGEMEMFFVHSGAAGA